MAMKETFSFSEMARNKALREIQEAIVPDDTSQTVANLIVGDTNLADLFEGIEAARVPTTTHELTIFMAGAKIGAQIAVERLLAAGLPEDQLPTQTLKQRMFGFSVASSAAMEARYDGDPADLYMPEDGGNG